MGRDVRLGAVRRDPGAIAFRYGAMLVVTLATLMLSLFVRDARGTRAGELVAAGTCLLIAVVTSEGAAPGRRAVAGGLVAVVATAAILAVAGVASSAVLLTLSALLLASTVAVIGGGLIRLVMQRGVVLQAVFGALAVYLLLGLIFAYTIGAVATGLDGAYFTNGSDGTQSERTYYSFTVLTTTGFGDFTAAMRSGRALAVLEMLTGQLYLVTVISLLVGNLRRSHGPLDPGA
jgi:hypothetical protein